MEQEHLSQSQSEASPLSGMLSSLLSNPEMMEKLRAMVGQLPSVGEPPAPSVSEPSPPPIPTDGLAAVLSDPKLMSELPQIMTMLRPMLGAAPTVSPSPKKERNAEDCRNDLLLALKPFLSPERCRAIDTMLRISKLGTVIRQIK